MPSDNRLRNLVRDERARLNSVSASAEDMEGVLFMSIDTVLSGTDPVHILVSGSVHNSGLTASLPVSPANGQRFKIMRVNGVLQQAAHAAQMLIVSGSGLGGSNPTADTADREIQGASAITAGSGLCIDKPSGSVDIVYSSDTTMWHVLSITGSTDWVGSI